MVFKRIMRQHFSKEWKKRNQETDALFYYVSSWFACLGGSPRPRCGWWIWLMSLSTKSPRIIEGEQKGQRYARANRLAHVVRLGIVNSYDFFFFPTYLFFCFLGVPVFKSELFSKLIVLKYALFEKTFSYLFFKINSFQICTISNHKPFQI